MLVVSRNLTSVCWASRAEGKESLFIGDSFDGPGQIVIRDPRRAASGSDVAYRVSGFHCGTSPVAPVARKAANALLDGFHCTVIGYGCRGLGKTRMLLGLPRSTGEGDKGVCCKALDIVFARLARGDEAARQLAVGLSVWEITATQQVDLLLASDKDGLGSEGRERRIIRVSSSGEARQVLSGAFARSASYQRAADDNNVPTPVPNRSHVFVRVHLVDTERSTVSSLLLADLAGTPSLAAIKDRGGASASSFDLSPEARQELNRQLLSFNRLLSDLASAASSGLKAGELVSRMTVYSGENRLTATLAPLLRANSRVFMIAALSGEPSDRSDTKATLRVAQRAQDISIPARRHNRIKDPSRFLLEELAAPGALATPEASEAPSAEDGDKVERDALLNASSAGGNRGVAAAGPPTDIPPKASKTPKRTTGPIRLSLKRKTQTEPRRVPETRASAAFDQEALSTADLNSELKATPPRQRVGANQGEFLSRSAFVGSRAAPRRGNGAPPLRDHHSQLIHTDFLDPEHVGASGYIRTGGEQVGDDSGYRPVLMEHISELDNESHRLLSSVASPGARRPEQDRFSPTLPSQRARASGRGGGSSANASQSSVAAAAEPIPRSPPRPTSGHALVLGDRGSTKSELPRFLSRDMVGVANGAVHWRVTVKPVAATGVVALDLPAEQTLQLLGLPVTGVIRTRRGSMRSNEDEEVLEILDANPAVNPDEASVRVVLGRRAGGRSFRFASATVAAARLAEAWGVHEGDLFLNTEFGLVSVAGGVVSFEPGRLAQDVYVRDKDAMGIASLVAREASEAKRREKAVAEAVAANAVSTSTDAMAAAGGEAEREIELKLADARLEVLRLRGKLRQFEKGLYAEAMDGYEAEIARLHRLNENLRSRNHALQIQPASASFAPTSSAPASSRARVLEQTLKGARSELRTLRLDFQQLQKKERVFKTAERLVQDLKTRLSKAGRDLGERTKQAQALSDSLSRLSSAHARLKEASLLMHHQREEAVRRADEYAAELRAMKEESSRLQRAEKERKLYEKIASERKARGRTLMTKKNRVPGMLELENAIARGNLPRHKVLDLLKIVEERVKAINRARRVAERNERDMVEMVLDVTSGTEVYRAKRWEKRRSPAKSPKQVAAASSYAELAAAAVSDDY